MPEYALSRVEGSEKLCLAFNEQTKNGGGIVVAVADILDQKQIAMRIARACVVCRRDVLVVNMAKLSMEVTNVDWRNSIMRRMDEMVVRRSLGTPTLIIEGFLSFSDKNPFNHEVVSWILQCISEILYSQNSVVIVSTMRCMRDGNPNLITMRKEIQDAYPEIGLKTVQELQIFKL